MLAWRLRLIRAREAALVWIAWHLPRSLAYWSTIRTGVHATTGAFSNQVVPDLYYTDVLQRWALAAPKSKRGAKVGGLVRKGLSKGLARKIAGVKKPKGK